MRTNKGNSPNKYPDEEPKVTKGVEDNESSHDTDMMFTNEMRDKLHGVLLLCAERMRVNWVGGEQN